MRMILRAVVKIYRTAFLPVLLLDMFVRWCIGLLPGPAQVPPALKTAALETLIVTVLVLGAMSVWATYRNRQIPPGSRVY